jgi:hypothetical protein
MKSFLTNSLIFLGALLVSFPLFANLSTYDGEDSIYEDSAEFNQFKQELSSDLKSEMDFIEQKTKDVTLFLEKNSETEKDATNIVTDEISNQKSSTLRPGVSRSPAIEKDEMNFKSDSNSNISDEELSTLFDSENNQRKPRRIRSR